MDRLETMLLKQKRFMASVGIYGEIDINTHIGQAAIRECAGYMFEEMGEALNLLKKKSWRKFASDTDIPKFREELTDVLHFYLELCILSGITVDQMYAGYLKKNLENVKRQEGGY